MTHLTATLDPWPLREPFSISRYTFTESLVLTIRVDDGHADGGFGECEPHEFDRRFALDMLSAAQLAEGGARQPAWADGLSRQNLSERMARSPLRNAVDCALWDLDAKRAGVRAHVLAGTPSEPIRVLPTLGIDTPDEMARRAASHVGAAWLKVKLGSSDGRDAERLEAVAGALPGVPLLLDANTGWSPQMLARMLPLARRLGVRMIEQPMTPDLDEAMPKPPGEIVFCADESCLDRSSLDRAARHFQAINIKLDKSGGLTESLALRADAERRGLGVMVGMMSGTSLSVAPAFILAQGLEVVDLELGFLTKDREAPMEIRDFMLQPPSALLWG